MTFDAPSWLLGDNPLYRARRGGPLGRNPVSVATMAILLAVLYSVPVGAALYAMGVWTRNAVDLAFMIGGLLPMLLGLVLPANAATSLSAERDSGVMDTLILSPYPRASSLGGLVAAHVQPWINLVVWSLPAFALTGPLLLLGQAHDTSAVSLSGVVFLPVLGVLGGIGWWLGVVLISLYAAMIGTWAAVEFRSTIGAVIMAYMLSFCLPMGISYIGCMLSGAVAALGRAAGEFPLVVLWLVLLAANLSIPVLLIRSALRRLDTAGEGGSR